MSYFKDLLRDNHFKSGFFLQGPDAVKDQRKVFSYLNYGNKAIKVNDTLWIMSQWWTPFNFKDAAFKEVEDNVFEYSNESRKCVINTNDGALRMILSSHEEYLKRFNGGRNDPSTTWSHFLIEQDFIESCKVKDLAALYMKLHFTLNEVRNYDGKDFDPNKHTAQFMWYITIREGDGNKKENGGGNFIWFGLPIYDYRYPFIRKHIQYDGDFAGSTKALIYNLDNRNYIEDKPLLFGKEYVINYDALPDILRAVRYAMKKKIFKSTKNLVINYMNIGWELPGSFDVDNEISNLQIKGVFHD